MRNYLPIAAILILLLFSSTLIAGAAPKSLKALETTLANDPIFMSGSFTYFPAQELNKIKKDLSAAGYVNGFDFGGNEGFSNSIYVVEFKGVINQLKASKLWKALAATLPGAKGSAKATIVTKGRYAVFYVKGSVPDAAITNIQKAL